MDGNEALQAILVVDDSEMEVELITMAIGAMHLPFRVEVVRNGQEALDFLYMRGSHSRRLPGMPALMILDNSMPVMSGTDAAREIRFDPAFHKMPIVMFSSSAFPNELAAAYDAGVNSYVLKPGMGGAHADTVQAIVNYWTKINVSLRPSALVRHYSALA